MKPCALALLAIAFLSLLACSKPSTQSIPSEPPPAKEDKVKAVIEEYIFNQHPYSKRLDTPPEALTYYLNKYEDEHLSDSSNNIRRFVYENPDGLYLILLGYQTVDAKGDPITVFILKSDTDYNLSLLSRFSQSSISYKHQGSSY